MDPVLSMAVLVLLIGLVFGAGRKQDGRKRAHLVPSYKREDGTPVRAYMAGRGKPSYTFTILIIAAFAFLLVLHAG